jgi:metal-responsive CopG/Arc/MetJ family transcriptional regulator
VTIGEIMSENKVRGRPKVKEKMEQITIKLPPKMLEGLKELSDKSYNPMSMHIRQAIAEYLEKNKIYD